MRQVKFAINVVSLLHLGLQWARFPGTFFTKTQRLIDDAMEDGWDGVQMLPTRGSTGNETGVLLWEQAWNAVDSLFQAILGEYGASGLESKPKDWVVSPNQNECIEISKRLAERGLQQVAHHPSMVPAGCLVEVNPDNRCNAKEYLGWMQPSKLGGFVIDTYHLRRPPIYADKGWVNELLDDNNPNCWQRSVELLAPHVKAVHVHPENLRKFLDSPTSYVEGRIIRTLRQAGANFREMVMVAEYEPPRQALMSAKTSREFSRQMLEAIHQLGDSSYLE